MRRIQTLLLGLAMLGASLGSGQAARAQDVGAPDAAGVFPSLVHQGDITEFLKLMSASTKKNIIPSKLVRGPVTVNLYDVTFDEALDVVLSSNGYAAEQKGAFIFVYTQKEYDELTARNRKMETKVFKLNYIPAKDVQELIKPLLSDDAEVTQSPDAGSAKSESGEQWAASNYLIVLDYAEQLEKITELIKTIDTRPAQVLIEATILVADVGDNNEFGIDFDVLGGKSNEDVSGTEFELSTGSNGLSISILTSSIDLAIKAIETVTDVVTIGTPKILTLNRQQGRVLVGNRDGYITTEVSQTTSTQTVEFLETGTQLKFRPFVMDDGYIRLELETEDSDGGVETKDGFTLPSETTASVTCNILVKDGQTIVIGGLFRDKTTINRSQVPIFGNLPLIGPIFGSTTNSVKKEEVIFMITPHIVQEAVDYAQAEQTMEDIDTLRLGIREGLLFQGRSRLASLNYQTARENEAAGNTWSALWHATLATSCNPMFLEALELREELLNRQIFEENYGSMQNFMQRILESETPATSWVEPEALDFSQDVAVHEITVSGPAAEALDANDTATESLNADFNIAWESAAAPVTAPLEAWEGEESPLTELIESELTEDATEASDADASEESSDSEVVEEATEEVVETEETDSVEDN